MDSVPPIRYCISEQIKPFRSIYLCVSQIALMKDINYWKKKHSQQVDADFEALIVFLKDSRFKQEMEQKRVLEEVGALREDVVAYSRQMVNVR